MGVLNEILTAIKFIKFFAWEGRWIERTEQARNTELGWLIKGVFVQYMRVDSVLTSMPVRLNRIMLGVLWALLPMLVPICSFFSFVMLGNEMTIAVAFTVSIPLAGDSFPHTNQNQSIALFSMIR